MKWSPPEKPTTDSESPWHGDSESGVGYGLAGCATETVIHLYTGIFWLPFHSSRRGLGVELRSRKPEIPGSIPRRTYF